MAKKKAKPAPAADNKNRIPRKEPYDSDRMTNVVERLREQAGRPLSACPYAR